MTLYTGGSDGFVSSTAAPIASGVERTQFPGGTFTRSQPAPFHGARVMGSLRQSRARMIVLEAAEGDVYAANQVPR